jgi:hypothetical protein
MLKVNETTKELEDYDRQGAPRDRSPKQANEANEYDEKDQAHSKPSVVQRGQLIHNQKRINDSGTAAIMPSAHRSALKAKFCCSTRRLSARSNPRNWSSVSGSKFIR